MRVILRYIVFSFIAVYFARIFVEGFTLGRGFFFVVIAIALLNLFSRPVIKITSLPSKGIGYFIVNVFLTFLTIFALTSFLPSVRIETTFTVGLLNLLNTLPIKNLNPLQTTIVASFTVGFIFNFLMWVGNKK